VRNAVVSTLVPALRRLRDDVALPSVQLSVNRQDGSSTVEFSELPVAVKVWTANNSRDRDFRYACGVRYTSVTLTPRQRFSLPHTPPETGWQAQFVEARFADGFIATSPVSVLPQVYPAHPPAQQDGACKSFPADAR